MFLKIQSLLLLDVVNLNLEICELVGAFIGDGYLSAFGKSQVVVGFAGNAVLDKDYLQNHLFNLIKRNFPFTNPRVRIRNDENTIMLRVYSKDFFSFFLQLGFKPGKKSRTVTIPSLILENEQYLGATIRGIFDTDGCLFFDKRKIYKKPYPRIVLQMASIPLIEQLEKYLSIDFSLFVDKSNRDGKRNSLEIYGYPQLERFLKQIGFSNQRHKSKVPL